MTLEDFLLFFGTAWPNSYEPHPPGDMFSVIGRALETFEMDHFEMWKIT